MTVTPHSYSKEVGTTHVPILQMRKSAQISLSPFLQPSTVVQAEKLTKRSIRCQFPSLFLVRWGKVPISGTHFQAQAEVTCVIPAISSPATVTKTGPESGTAISLGL